MNYLKAFEAILPAKAINHLDVGTGERFRFSNILLADNSLYNDVNPILKSLPSPCFYGNALLLSKYLKENYFDLITCFDVIEHLKKDDGYELIKGLENLSNNTIIFFTPLGEIAVGQSKIQYHVHLSGWLPEDFVKLGYKCWVFPNFHKIYGYGAFFAIKTKTPLPKVKLASIDKIFDGEFWVEN